MVAIQLLDLPNNLLLYGRNFWTNLITQNKMMLDKTKRISDVHDISLV